MVRRSCPVWVAGAVVLALLPVVAWADPPSFDIATPLAVAQAQLYTMLNQASPTLFQLFAVLVGVGMLMRIFERVTK
jgi:hypothetical protein